jgi:hypothetical protein
MTAPNSKQVMTLATGEFISWFLLDLKAGR